MKVKWTHADYVNVERVTGQDYKLRETWRFEFAAGVLALISYTRESLLRPQRRYRFQAEWREEDGGTWAWSRNYAQPPASVPMSNALATEILAVVAESLAVKHQGVDLPTLGYRLSGLDDDASAEEPFHP
jgi:hypothetical protein